MLTGLLFPVSLWSFLKMGTSAFLQSLMTSPSLYELSERREIGLVRTPPEAACLAPQTCMGRVPSSSLKFPELTLTSCWRFCSSLNPASNTELEDLAGED